MQATFKFFLSCLICLALSLLSGCGGSVSLTPAEKAEVDPYITKHGKDALVHYLRDVRKDTDEKLVLKYCKYLVSQGADVNAGNDDPLDSAARQGNIEVVKFLVSKGADMKARNGLNGLLVHATYSGNIELVKFFISKGADVNTKYQGTTPLEAAIRSRNIEAVKFLVSKGADVKKDTTWMLINEAKKQGHWEIVEYLSAVAQPYYDYDDDLRRRVD